jgi:hypothetical protein
MPPEVRVHVAEAQSLAQKLAHVLQQAFWKAEDHGAAEVATRVERLEMSLREVRDELKKLRGGES